MRGVCGCIYQPIERPYGRCAGHFLVLWPGDQHRAAIPARRPARRLAVRRVPARGGGCARMGDAAHRRPPPGPAPHLGVHALWRRFGEGALRGGAVAEGAAEGARQPRHGPARPPLGAVALGSRIAAGLHLQANPQSAGCAHVPAGVAQLDDTTTAAAAAATTTTAVAAAGSCNGEFPRARVLQRDADGVAHAVGGSVGAGDPRARHIRSVQPVWPPEELQAAVGPPLCLHHLRESG
mmetsp:Transcript_9080/g.17002  ORF Transcript_9080/g.17002 Transcript_9080/m.17002 type:complete len:237 (-) Transcript_9080:2539-3249(-)